MKRKQNHNRRTHKVKMLRRYNHHDNFESLTLNKGGKFIPGIIVFVFAGILGLHFIFQSHAATFATSVEAESGTVSGNAKTITDGNASGGSAIQFGTTTQSQGCTNPVFTTSQQFGTWNYASNILVNNNVWGPSGTSWSQQLNACSSSSWYVNANIKADGGAIQTYPDTEYNFSSKTLAQYNSMQTCFDETRPTGGEWDIAYDNWLNNFGIEVMVWNEWTDTGIYPPSNARAVTIDGVAYHTWKGGGGNEWIYTRDTQVSSGCFDLLHIFQDLVAHPSTSGITSSSVPNAIEYGIEIASTNGTETFKVNNFTVTAN